MGTEHINHYHLKPRPWFYSKTQFSGRRSNSAKTLYMGFELEVEFPKYKWIKSTGIYEYPNGQTPAKICDFLYEHSGRENEPERYYHLERDGSVYNGLEIVSQPMTLWFHRQFIWKQIVEYLNAAGCKSHDTTTCGLHVHVNKSFFEDSDMVKLGIFVNAQKGEMVKLARRGESHYAKFKKINQFTKDEEIVGSWDRYEAVNFTNPKTIEFRLFRGTLNYKTIIATLELVDAVCRFVKTQNQTDLLSCSSWEGFIKYLKKYPKKFVALNAYMTERKVT